ncbi:NAD(P)H-hydrate dehydratase [Candidatus Woesearchaeota archaeon]|nr:NAD(P)H-hydrate dehydratase [Candidatus Woesearchaeota archaeon]
MITTQQMHILEQNAAYYGVSTVQLMENAGKGIADYIKQHFPNKKVIVVAGHGNNGGDGFVAARYLNCKVYFVGYKEKLTPLALKNIKRLHKQQFVDDFNNVDIIVDAIFGCGFKGEVREPYVSVIKKINNLKMQKKIRNIISVDIPSGLDANTGKGSLFVKADIMLTMHDTKQGLKQFKVEVLDIGIPKKAIIQTGPGDVKSVIPHRTDQSHKGDFGRVLVVAGSLDYPGAAVLVCQALVALRSGVDLITVAAPEKTALLINSFIPDIITKKLKGDYFSKEHIHKILALMMKADAIVIGPGLSLQSKGFIQKIIKKTSKLSKNMVIDADALKSIKIADVKHAILTPHAKEFEMLTKEKLPQNLNQKIKLLQRYAKHNCILLKGNPDIIAYQGRYKLNYTGNPGMTVGGTGDILAGLCAGFLAQSGDLFQSACAAAFVNGLAGDRLKKELGYGFIASDISKEIAKIIRSLHNFKM